MIYIAKRQQDKWCCGHSYQRKKKKKPKAGYCPITARPPPDPQRKLVNAICSTVAGWLREGRLLESKGRAVKAGDILIWYASAVY